MKKICIYLIISLLAISCTEPFALKERDFEDLLVVEATITNEWKHQKIKLSRTISLEKDTPVFEHGAIVKISDSNGTTYLFSETNNEYISNQEFKAEQGVSYTLFIETSNGNQYSSESEKTPSETQIAEVVAQQETKDNILGVSIRVNSNDPTQNSNFYRYEFEETYKIIAPYWSPNDVILGPNNEFIVVPRTVQNQICYSTDNSNTINTYSTELLNEDFVLNHLVHFLPKDNPKITHRYSILVKQYVQNKKAYNFYKTLKSLNSNGNLLSQVQPGYIEGNIKNKNNFDEKIVGYFDVSTLSTKRIFFNFNDIFPNETSDSYFFKCGIESYDSNVPFVSADSPYYGGYEDLIYVIQNNESILFYEYFTPPPSHHHIFLMVKPHCGDCTTFSSNVVPSFWQ